MNKISWQPILENELVLLRPLEAWDHDELFDVASDPLLWEQHPSNDRYKPEVFMMFFEEALAGSLTFVIIDKPTQKIIGSSRYYDLDLDNHSVKIGYSFLGRDYWGGKYNFAHKKLLIDYAFQFLNRVFFEIGETNFRSQKGTEKLGIEKVNHFLKEVNGEQFPYITYVLTKEKWEGQS
ncbi:GNAT family N-acetyltransferase [Fluviicola taffensis]|uniref:Acetyltransferase n=1 Tax=Fluviicola taffensis (strain DSM 16823 / NCIMB 13979 / RW262) TaxID=755732 RepID=F2IES3_FLUTR|nr:GNAT family N-acetyltransferase [Fluviicola taffensis]AEA45640.1 acetyltransferase [Fluviicola taffensis DSM 16823]